MKTIRDRWHPAGNGMWHHFIITETPIKKGIGSDTRVAYETTDGISQVATSPELFSDALRCAAWNLAPAEYRAFQNLALYPDGTVSWDRALVR